MSNGSKLNKRHYFVKILVIDDIFYVKKTMTRILNNAGFFVLTASSSQEAVEKISKYSPDLITVSHKLSDMSGEIFVHQYKELFKVNDLKLIIISNRNQMAKTKSLLSEHIDDIILKPICKEELISKIQSFFPPL